MKGLLLRDLLLLKKYLIYCVFVTLIMAFIQDSLQAVLGLDYFLAIMLYIFPLSVYYIVPFISTPRSIANLPFSRQQLAVSKYIWLLVLSFLFAITLLFLSEVEKKACLVLICKHLMGVTFFIPLMFMRKTSCKASLIRKRIYTSVCILTSIIILLAPWGSEHSFLYVILTGIANLFSFIFTMYLVKEDRFGKVSTVGLLSIVIFTILLATVDLSPPVQVTKSDTSPWEFLNMDSWSDSEFANDFNLQKEVAENLEKYIESFEGVKEASMNITSVETIFENQKPVGVYVLIIQEPDSIFSQDQKQIDAIKERIKMTVPYIKLDDISISVQKESVFPSIWN